MKAIRAVLLLHFLWVGSFWVRAQDLNVQERLEVILQSQLLVQDFENLLILLSDEGTTGTVSEILIRNSYSPGRNQLFLNESVVLENDLHPRYASGNLPPEDMSVSEYLQYFFLFYEKSSRESLEFTSIKALNDVEEQDYKFVRVYFECQLKGRHKEVHDLYPPVKRIAEIRIEREGMGWRPYINGITYFRDNASASGLPKGGDSDLTQLKEAAARAKADMEVEQEAARAAGGLEFAPTEYNDALEKARIGRRNLEKGTAESLSASEGAFLEASQKFSEARALAQPRQAQKQRAEQAKTAMEQAKSRVGGNETHQREDSFFRRAENKSLDGMQALQSRDFDLAYTAFGEAEVFYTQAHTTIENRLKDLRESANLEKAQKEKDLAISKIRQLLAHYKVHLENKDHKALGEFLEVAGNWKTFFSIAKEIVVDIEDSNIQLAPTTADVSFRVHISYRNQGKQEQDFFRKWELEKEGAQWKIIDMQFE